MVKAKVRGIYATALTKLLLDNDFEIVQPSVAIHKRFHLPEDPAPPDLKINSKNNLQGVKVLGTPKSVGAFRSVLHTTVENAVTRKWPVSVDGIYQGKVMKSEGKTVYVDIGNGVVGKLPRSEMANMEQEQVVVVVDRKGIGAKNPILSTELKMVGKYGILVQNSRGGVSLKIRDPEERSRLYKWGKRLAPDGWGIIWRKSSENMSYERLEDEITMLTQKIRLLDQKASHPEGSTLLVEGSYSMDVEFPSTSKSHLDRLRASVAPTLDGHHYYRSCGGEVSSALEMAENLLKKGRDRNQVEKTFHNQIMYLFPEPGSVVDVEHVKLSGMVLHLGPAKIESLEDGQIKYSRIMRSNGFYDGLNVRKQAGNKAISETTTDEWYITTKYFSNEGQWKGTYINLNTPVEVYPETIRYVDLEVDVCIQPDDTVKVVDMEKLEKAWKNKVISDPLFHTIKEKVEKITEAAG